MFEQCVSGTADGRDIFICLMHMNHTTERQAFSFYIADDDGQMDFYTTSLHNRNSYNRDLLTGIKLGLNVVIQRTSSLRPAARRLLVVGRPLRLASGRDEVASSLLQAVWRSHASRGEEVLNAQTRMDTTMVYVAKFSGGMVLHRSCLIDDRQLMFESCLKSEGQMVFTARQGRNMFCKRNFTP